LFNPINFFLHTWSDSDVLYTTVNAPLQTPSKRRPSVS